MGSDIFSLLHSTLLSSASSSHECCFTDDTGCGLSEQRCILGYRAVSSLQFCRRAPSGETECLRNCRDVSYMDWNVLKDGDRGSEGETPGGDEGAPHLND